MKWKKVVLSLVFLPKFHEIWRFWRFWAEFSAKFEKKNWGVKNYPFSSIIHVSIVFGNGHLQSAGPKILGHIIYRWKDLEKFYPVKVVRAWTIYMESCKFQLKLPLFRYFADFVESSKYRSGSEKLIKWDILYTVGKLLRRSIQWKWSEPGQFIWEAAKSSWSCPFFAISRIFFQSG